MYLHIPAVLGHQEVAAIRARLLGGPWANGNQTAGTQSAQVKNNLQLDERLPEAVAARESVMTALARSATLLSAALPRRIFPPLFNRYTGVHNAFGDHIDNAMRTVVATGAMVRTDLSCTLFLSEPESYAGGELVIQPHASSLAPARLKFAAGDLVLYEGNTVHRVEPVTQGERLAAFFWIESLVRDTAQRVLLYELDMTIMRLRRTLGDTDDIVRLTGTYHNLLRLWGQP
jgi:PKHD-type hydroxylase